MLTFFFNSNAFIFPVVYFFYPETAYRSLEEMDNIFRKTTSIFDVVRVAREEPRLYGKHGELLISAEAGENVHGVTQGSDEKGQTVIHNGDSEAQAGKSSESD